MRFIHLFGLFAVASLGACSTILGFEPLSLDPGAAEAGAPGDGASDSATGDGGAGNETSANGDDGATGDSAACGASDDPKNCGACGHDCAGGACQGSVCQPVKLADGLQQPEGIAVDDTSVFVAEFGADRILKLGKSSPGSCTGGPSSCVFTEGDANVHRPTAMTADSANVYWANAGGNAEHQIRACARAGCGGGGAALIASLDVEAFGHIFGTEVLPLNLIVRNGRVYWPENNSGALRSAQIDGGGLVTYLENASFAPVDIAVDDAFVYFTDDSNQHPTRVQAAPLDGSARDGGVKIVASTPSRPFGIALRDPTLYFTIIRINGVGDGLLQTAPKTGIPDAGEPVGAVASNQVEPTSVMVDAANVYWVQAGSDNAPTGMVVTCPLAGCPATGPVILASQQNQPRHLAQDDTAIYWSNEGTGTDGQIWKVAKP